MSLLSTVLPLVLLVPYLAWGVYTLRLRYVYHEDLPLRMEAATLAFVAVFFAVEIMLFQVSMSDDRILFIFTALGLFVSGAALYGPMLASLASQAVVDLMLPRRPEEQHKPQFAAADALERLGDYEGALEECLIMARIFPKDPATSLRVADNLTKLDRYQEATVWFERGLKRISDHDRSLRIATRLAEIYQKELEQPQEAKRILETFLDKHPDTERRDSVMRRVSRLSETSPNGAREGSRS